jgi:FlaA1/EpsC-like NDP-sugar epimerase
MKPTISKKLLELRNRHFFIVDVIIFLLTPLLALILRLDGSVELDSYKLGLAVVTVLFLTVKLSVFITQGFYKRYWRYASRDELIQIAVLTASTVVLHSLFQFAVLPHQFLC